MLAALPSHAVLRKVGQQKSELRQMDLGAQVEVNRLVSTECGLGF